MQQTKEDAQNGVTGEHREGLAEYNEKLQSKGGGGGQQGRTHHGQQQQPAGTAPGMGARSAGSRRRSRRPGRGQRRR